MMQSIPARREALGMASVHTLGRWRWLRELVSFPTSFCVCNISKVSQWLAIVSNPFGTRRSHVNHDEFLWCLKTEIVN